MNGLLSRTDRFSITDLQNDALYSMFLQRRDVFVNCSTVWQQKVHSNATVACSHAMDNASVQTDYYTTVLFGQLAEVLK